MAVPSSTLVERASSGILLAQKTKATEVQVSQLLSPLKGLGPARGQHRNRRLGHGHISVVQSASKHGGLALDPQRSEPDAAFPSSGTIASGPEASPSIGSDTLWRSAVFSVPPL